MDYRINNEAIISCVIAQVLKRESCDSLRLSLLIPLLMENKTVNNTDLTLVYKEYLPIVVNSIIILTQGNIIRNGGGIISLTDKGNEFCNGMLNHSCSYRLRAIISEIDTCLEETQKFSTVELISKIKNYSMNFYIKKIRLWF